VAFGNAVEAIALSFCSLSIPSVEWIPRKNRKKIRLAVIGEWKSVSTLSHLGRGETKSKSEAAPEN
jgi:hypothetical protein